MSKVQDSQKGIFNQMNSGAQNMLQGAEKFVSGTLNRFGNAIATPIKVSQIKVSYEVFKFKRKVYDIEKSCTYNQEWLKTKVFSPVTGSGKTHDEVLLALHEVQKEYFFLDRAKKILRWREHKVVDGGIELYWDQAKQGFVMIYKLKVARADKRSEIHNTLTGRGYFRTFFNNQNESQMKDFIFTKIKPSLQDLNNTLRNDQSRYPNFLASDHETSTFSKNQPPIYYSPATSVVINNENMIILGGEQFTAYFDSIV